jgi:hypothetical protein
MNRIFFLALTIPIQSLSFGQEVFKQPVILIKGETHVEITGSKNIESDSVAGRFEMRSGSFDINVSGLIDRSASRKIFISLFADVIVKNDLMIFSSKGKRVVQYFVEGIPSGNYSGQYSDNANFTVSIKFKIIAPGYLSYFLVLPISVYVSAEGKVSYEKSFISGTAYISNLKPVNKKKRKKTVVHSQSLLETSL